MQAVFMLEVLLSMFRRLVTGLRTDLLAYVYELYTSEIIISLYLNACFLLETCLVLLCWELVLIVNIKFLTLTSDDVTLIFFYLYNW